MAALSTSKPAGGELQLDHAAQLFFVFDHQDALFHAEPASFGGRRAPSGSSTRNTLPLPGSLSTVILPPCSSTILETMASPSPTPSGLVVKNGLKMVSRCSGSMPRAAVDHRDFRDAFAGAGLHA